MKVIRKQTLCDKCANLRSKVGREYRCPAGHGFVQYFKKAPSYCINFKPREEG